MASERLTLIEQEGVTKTITVKQAGAVFALTGYTVTFRARDMNAAKGTLITLLSAGTVNITDASNGVLTVTFTVAQTAMPTGGDDVDGQWCLKMVNGTITRYTRFGRLSLVRNDFES